MSDKPTKRRTKRKYEPQEPVSLAPLDFETALAALLKPARKKTEDRADSPESSPQDNPPQSSNPPVCRRLPGGPS